MYRNHKSGIIGIIDHRLALSRQKIGQIEGNPQKQNPDPGGEAADAAVRAGIRLTLFHPLPPPALKYKGPG